MFSGSRNSKFQYLYFVLGECHTPDEAYRVMQEQLDDREGALAAADAVFLRLRAKRLRVEGVLEDPDTDEPTRLEAEADLVEIVNGEAAHRRAYAEAARERDFLCKLIDEIAPLRRYRDLPDHEARQACQREEWAHKLIVRAENYLATVGTIPADHFGAMRMHPDFPTRILPRIAAVEQAKAAGKVLMSPPPEYHRILLAATDLPALEDTTARIRRLGAPACVTEAHRETKE